MNLIETLNSPSVRQPETIHPDASNALTDMLQKDLESLEVAEKGLSQYETERIRLSARIVSLREAIALFEVKE